MNAALQSETLEPIPARLVGSGLGLGLLAPLAVGEEGEPVGGLGVGRCARGHSEGPAPHASPRLVRAPAPGCEHLAPPTPAGAWYAAREEARASKKK